MPTIQEQMEAYAKTVAVTTTDGYRFTKRELDNAFARVVNKDNWKGKIDTIIELNGDPNRDIACIKAAIQHIADCEAAVNYVKESTQTRPIVSVMAPGCYICMGS
jgi:hypothetical protein